MKPHAAQEQQDHGRDAYAEDHARNDARDHPDHAGDHRDEALNRGRRDATALEDLDAKAEPRPLSDLWRLSWTWNDEVRWRAQALGKSAWQYWELVQARPGLTTRALGKLRGVGVRAAQRQLGKLATAGLVVRDVERRWWAGATLPDEAAEKVGIAGAGEAQHARHVVEREARREQMLRSRQIRGRCDAGGELVAFEVGYEFDPAVAAAARVLPGASWDRRRRVWVVPLSRAAAAALVPFAQAHGFEIREDAQAAIDAEATTSRRAGGWRAR